jgi:hypothetical protein
MFGLMLRSKFDNAVKLFFTQYNMTEYGKRKVFEKRFPHLKIINNVLKFNYYGDTVTVTFYENSDSVKSIRGGLWLLEYSKD